MLPDLPDSWCYCLLFSHLKNNSKIIAFFLYFIWYIQIFVLFLVQQTETNQLFETLKKMKTLTNIETGKLNEFGNFYQNVDFQNQGSQDVYNLIEKELSDDIEDIKDSPEFWWSEFVNPFDNETYVIAADGEATSSGKYIVAQIVEE